MKLSILILNYFILACLYNLYSSNSGNEIRVGLSDLLPETINNILAQTTLPEEDTLVSYQSGTLPMIDDFSLKELDMCLVALPEGELIQLPEELNIQKIPIAYLTAVIIVHQDNPLNDITSDQLTSIYSDDASGIDVRSWRDVGLSSYSTALIKPYAVSQNESISSDLFRYLLLDSNAFKNSVSLVGQSEIEQSVSQDKSSIGIISNLPITQNVKVLHIAAGDDPIGYGPSNDNIFFSDYPIRLPFYLIFKDTDTERLLPLINKLLGADVETLLSNNGFFPVPSNIKDRFFLDLQAMVNDSTDEIQNN